jgi:hypothetical protein
MEIFGTSPGSKLRRVFIKRAEGGGREEKEGRGRGREGRKERRTNPASGLLPSDPQAPPTWGSDSYYGPSSLVAVPEGRRRERAEGGRGRGGERERGRGEEGEEEGLTQSQVFFQVIHKLPQLGEAIPITDHLPWRLIHHQEARTIAEQLSILDSAVYDRIMPGYIPPSSSTHPSPGSY